MSYGKALRIVNEAVKRVGSDRAFTLLDITEMLEVIADEHTQEGKYLGEPDKWLVANGLKTTSDVERVLITLRQKGAFL